MIYYNEKQILKLEKIFELKLSQKGYTLRKVKDNPLFEDQIIAYIPDDICAPTIRFLEIKECPEIHKGGYLISLTVEITEESHEIIEHAKIKRELAFIRIVQPDFKCTKEAFEIAIDHLIQLFEGYNKTNPLPDTLKSFCETF